MIPKKEQFNLKVEIPFSEKFEFSWKYSDKGKKFTKNVLLQYLGENIFTDGDGELYDVEVGGGMITNIKSRS